MSDGASNLLYADKWVVNVRDSLLPDLYRLDLVLQEYDSVIDANITAAQFEISLILAVVRHRLVRSVANRLGPDEPYKSILYQEEVDVNNGVRMTRQIEIAVMLKSEYMEELNRPEDEDADALYRRFFEDVVDDNIFRFD